MKSKHLFRWRNSQKSGGISRIFSNISHSVFNLARQKNAGLSVHGVIHMGNCSIEAGIRRLVPVEVSGYPVVTPPKAAREPSDLKRGLPLFHNLVYWLAFVGKKSPRPTFYHFAGHFWYSIRSVNTG